MHPLAEPQVARHQAAERREASPPQAQVYRHLEAWHLEASFPVAQPLEEASQGERRQGEASSPLVWGLGGGR